MDDVIRTDIPPPEPQTLTAIISRLEPGESFYTTKSIATVRTLASRVKGDLGKGREFIIAREGRGVRIWRKKTNGHAN